MLRAGKGIIAPNHPEALRVCVEVEALESRRLLSAAAINTGEADDTAALVTTP